MSKIESINEFKKRGGKIKKCKTWKSKIKEPNIINKSFNQTGIVNTKSTERGELYD